MNPSNFSEDKQAIISIIKQLTRAGGSSNFVVFPLNSTFYIQMAAAKGDSEIYCEAVSNNYLKEGATLTKKQIDTLKNLSWNAPLDLQGNYYIKYRVDSESAKQQLADLVLKTAEQAYNCKGIDLDNIVLTLE